MMGVIYLITISMAGLLVLLVPAIFVALAHAEAELAKNMVLLAATGLFVIVAVLTAISGKTRRAERAFSYLALVGVWAVTPLLGAIFLVVLAGLPFVPAWFESVSALTTSGASVLVRDHVPNGLLFWRALLEWYGGFLALASIIYVLAPAGFGGLYSGSSSRVAFGMPYEGIFKLENYRTLALQYSLMTGVIFLGLVIFGVEPLTASMLGMVSAATGGFLPFVGPLEEHISRGASTVMALGLCLGTMSVFWRRQILRRPNQIFQNNLEAKIVAAVIIALTIAYATRILDVSGGKIAGSILAALQEGFFTAASLVATSGIETRPGVIALLPSVLILAIIFVGAGVYSTSGGVKVLRIGAMWVYAIAELNRLIYPNSVDRLKFGDMTINRGSMQAIWTYFIIAVIVIGLGSMFIALTATGFEAAIAMSVALFSNAGPVYEALAPVSGVTEGGWPVYQNMPSPLTYLLGIIIMTVGRLEVLVVFAVLNVRFWYNR